MQQKLVPDLFIILVNNLKQSLYAQNYFKSKIFWKKITSFFISNPVPFNRQNYQKQGTRGLELVTSRYLGYKTSSEIFDEVWWYTIKRFLSFSKNYVSKFMQANFWHHKLFHFHLPFWIWTLWNKKGKNHKNLNISRTKRDFKMK